MDTSTSIGFDEAKPRIVWATNRYLNGRRGRVIFFNTGIDTEVYTSEISEDQFDMRGQSHIWDTMGAVLERFPYMGVKLAVYTDAQDTASRIWSWEKVRELMRTLAWEVEWLFMEPPSLVKRYVCL